jgi:hypothetical protein
MVVRNIFQTGYPESLKTARGGIDQKGSGREPANKDRVISLLKHIGVGRDGEEQEEFGSRQPRGVGGIPRRYDCKRCCVSAASRKAILMQFRLGVKSPKYTFLQFSTQVCPKSAPAIPISPRDYIRKKCNKIIQQPSCKIEGCFARQPALEAT